jgi:hypothetical protein
MKHPRAATGWLLTAAYCTLLFAAVLTAGYFAGVPVPFAETLYFSRLLENAEIFGYLHPNSLLLEIREQQVLFPTLMMFAAEWVLGLRMLTPGSIRAFTLLTPVFAACSLGIAALLSHATMRHRSVRVRQVFAAFSATALFSLSQWETWSAMTFAFTMTVALVLCAFALLSLVRHSLLLVVSAAALCFLATFSFSAGMASWIAALPLLLWADERQTRRGRSIAIIVWAHAALASFGLFMLRYLAVPPPVGPADAFLPLKSVWFFFTVLGAPLAGWTLPWTLPSFAAGVVLAVALATSFSRAGATHRRQLLPWMAVSLFCILTALMITYGRVAHGMETALSSRFITLLSPLVISLAAAALIGGMRGKTALRYMALFLLLQGAFAVTGSEFLLDRRVHLAIGEACFRTQALSTDHCLGRLTFQRPGYARERAQVMERLGILEPFTLPPDVRIGKRNPERDAAWVDSIEPGPDSPLLATGWAVKDGCAAWDVVFTAGPKRTLVGYTHAVRPRPDSFGGCSLYSGWYLELDPDRLPPEAMLHPIETWLYDAQTHTLVPSGAPTFRLEDRSIQY